jgi:hypothetical protein
VPLQTLPGLQPGQGIPTGQAGHLLVKTETGQYQILKVGTSMPSTTMTSSLPTSRATSLPTQPVPPLQSHLRPQLQQVITRMPTSTMPAAVAASTAATLTNASPVRAPATGTSAAGGGGGGGMGQQMTPEAAKQELSRDLIAVGQRSACWSGAERARPDPGFDRRPRGTRDIHDAAPE